MSRPGRLFEAAVDASAASTLLRATFVLQTLVVARTLGPDATGLLGLSSVFATFIAVLGASCEVPAVAGRGVSDEEYAAAGARTRWFLTWLLVGVVAAGLAVSDARELRSILLLHLTYPLAEAWGARSRILRQRRLEFGVLTRAAVATGAFQAIVTVSVVTLGYGVIGAVAAQAASAGLNAMMIRSGDRTAFPMPQATTVREVLAGLARLLTGTLPQILGTRSDNLLVTATLGPGALAVYSLSYGAARLPSQIVEWVAGTVLLPILATGLASGSLRPEANRAVSMGGLVAPFVAAAIWFLAPWSLLLLDARWLALPGCLQIMAIGVLPVPLLFVAGAILNAAGKSHLLALPGLLVIAWQCVAIPVATARWGISGAAWVDVVTVLIATTVAFALCQRIGHSFSARAVRSVALSALTMVFAAAAGSVVAGVVGGERLAGPVIGLGVCWAGYAAAQVALGYGDDLRSLARALVRSRGSH